MGVIVKSKHPRSEEVDSLTSSSAVYVLAHFKLYSLVGWDRLKRLDKGKDKKHVSFQGEYKQFRR